MSNTDQDPTGDVEPDSGRRKFDDVASLFGTIVPPAGTPVRSHASPTPQPAPPLRTVPDAALDAQHGPRLTPPPPLRGPADTQRSQPAPDPPRPRLPVDAAATPADSNGLDWPVTPREKPGRPQRRPSKEVPWPDAFAPRPNFQRAPISRVWYWLFLIPFAIVVAVAITLVDPRSIRSFIDATLPQYLPVEVRGWFASLHSAPAPPMIAPPNAAPSESIPADAASTPEPATSPSPTTAPASSTAPSSAPAANSAAPTSPLPTSAPPTDAAPESASSASAPPTSAAPSVTPAVAPEPVTKVPPAATPPAAAQPPQPEVAAPPPSRQAPAASEAAPPTPVPAAPVPAETPAPVQPPVADSSSPAPATAATTPIPLPPPAPAPAATNAAHVIVYYRRSQSGAESEARRVAAKLGNAELRSSNRTSRSPTILYFSAADKEAAAGLARTLAGGGTGWIVRAGTSRTGAGTIEVLLP